VLVLLMRIAARVVVLAVAIAITAWIVPNIEVSGGLLAYLWIALLFAVVNALLGPILHLLALPLTVLTFGLFALVVNAALLGITALLTTQLDVDGFLTAVVSALLISLLSWVLTFFVPDPA
jgi:putative membrane protein